MQQVFFEAEAGNVEGDLGVPEVDVGRARQVGPYQCGDGCRQQNDAARGLDVEESLHRSANGASHGPLAGQPGRKPRSGRLGFGHGWSRATGESRSALAARPQSTPIAVPLATSSGRWAPAYILAPPVRPATAIAAALVGQLEVPGWL